MKTRLENLRSAYRMNWKELAAEIGISRSMLDFIRAGTAPVSPKTIRKIEAAEIKIGIAPVPKRHLSFPATAESPPSMRDPSADYMKDGDTVMGKLDEILRRLAEVERRLKSGFGR